MSMQVLGFLGRALLVLANSYISMQGDTARRGAPVVQRA
jgi:hypothetical protein